MDDPIVAHMNQTGENPDWFYGAGECEVKFVGACAWCGKNIYDDYEYVVDEDENVFCDQYEAMDFHGIKEIG